MKLLNNTVPTDAKGTATPTPDRELTSLRDKSGLVQRYKADRAASAAAGSALKLLQTEQVTSEANIALTTMKLAETKIRTSLVADSMRVIGAVTVRLQTATRAVDEALAGTTHAAMYATLAARDQSRGMFDELLGKGCISAEEREVLRGLVEQDATDDIRRVRVRAADAREAVDALHAFAQQGIAEAKDKLL